MEEPYCLTLSLASCSKVLHCRGLEGRGNKLGGLSVYPERPLEKSMIPSTNCFVPYHERTLNMFQAGVGVQLHCLSLVFRPDAFPQCNVRDLVKTSGRPWLCPARPFTSFFSLGNFGISVMFYQLLHLPQTSL